MNSDETSNYITKNEFDVVRYILLTFWKEI